MLYGIIDIGSNTIRGVVYKHEDKKIQKIEDKLVRSHILRETHNGILSETGINRLIVVLNKLRYVMKKCGCENIECFATSAMRDVENSDEVKEFVLSATGISIDILTEEQEAGYDFIAIRNMVLEHSAVGLDLGGGSGQIVQFEYNRLLRARSYKIGAGRVNKRYVKRNVADGEERKQIEFYVKNMLADEKNIFGTRYIYAMGGSVRAALKIYNFLARKDEKSNFLSVEDMDKILKLTQSAPQKMFECFYEIVKTRAETVVTGIIILKKICEILDVEGIYVLSCSIRDGYLASMIKNT